MSGTEFGHLQCLLSIEELGESGTVKKRMTHRNCMLILGRNEFREIALRVEHQNFRESFRIEDLRIFRRFAHEGKATIRIAKQKMQLLLSNCPPDKLLGFLALFVTKLSNQAPRTVTARQRLLSQYKGEFTEISPLDSKELQSVSNARARAAEQSGGSTPKGKALKRKITYDHLEKENPNGNKRSKLKSTAEILNSMTTEVLTPEQERVMRLARSGSSVFFTGNAGTGKSFLLRKIIGRLKLV